MASAAEMIAIIKTIPAAMPRVDDTFSNLKALSEEVPTFQFDCYATDLKQRMFYNGEGEFIPMGGTKL